MTSETAVVVAALGASLLTGLFTWGLSAWVQWLQGRDHARRERRVVYARMMRQANHLIALGMRAQVILQHRIGVAENVGALLGLRTPVDLDALQDKLERALVGLLDAQSEVWTVGTPDAISSAEVLITEASTYLTDSGRMTPAQSRSAGIAGWKPTAQQSTDLERQLARVRHAHVQFAQVVRAEMGQPPAQLGPPADQTGQSRAGAASQVRIRRPGS